MPRAFLLLSLLVWLFVANDNVPALVSSAVHDFGMFANRHVASLLAPLKKQ